MYVVNKFTLTYSIEHQYTYIASLSTVSQYLGILPFRRELFCGNVSYISSLLQILISGPLTTRDPSRSHEISYKTYCGEYFLLRCKLAVR